MCYMEESPQNQLIRLSAPPERLTIARHSGPGLRLIFWVQGCRLRCTKNCLNPHLLSEHGGYLTLAAVLTDRLLKYARDYREVEGITVLGGEPFDQAEALADALSPLRETGLSVMLYTGHTLASLRASAKPDIARLLALCDILVDGPFIDELYDETLVWRGSLNQRVILMSQRYIQEDIERAIALQGRALSVSIGRRGDVAVSGAQNLHTARQLTQIARPLKSDEVTGERRESYE
jgi:anaerobic ribonucleoside-triphosphate reductase activating protein